jgi:hypothetical protein
MGKVGVWLYSFLQPFFWYLSVTPKNAVLVAPVCVCGLARLGQGVKCVLKNKSDINIGVRLFDKFMFRPIARRPEAFDL